MRAFLEADFAGPSHTVRFRHAYARQLQLGTTFRF